MKCQHSSGEVIYLVLNATYCETCGQHVHCNSCIKVRVSVDVFLLFNGASALKFIL